MRWDKELIFASCIAIGLSQGIRAESNPESGAGQSGLSAEGDDQNETESMGVATDELNPELVSPDARIRGKTHTEWAEAWWRWVWSIPADANPELVLDTDCDVNQQGDVFFIAGYQRAFVWSRTCNIHGRKFILFPSFVRLVDYPCPNPDFQPEPGQSLPAFLRALAATYIDLARNIIVTVDGAPVSGIDNFRLTTPPFEFIGDTSLQVLDPCITGTRQPAVGDGYFLMLKPLSRGIHTVRVRGRAPIGRDLDYTYILNVTRR